MTMGLFLALSTTVWFILKVSFSWLVHRVSVKRTLCLFSYYIVGTVHDSVSCDDLAIAIATVCVDTRCKIIFNRGPLAV